MRCTSIPGWWMGIMKTVRPRCLGTSQLVRSKARPQSDHQAPVVHTFEPLTTHWSPSRTAVVERAGHVRAAARLGEELHPQLVTAQDGRDVTQLLLLGAVLEDHRRTGRKVGTWKRMG